MVGGAGSTVAVRERGLSGVRRERPIVLERESFGFFCFISDFFFLKKTYIFNKNKFIQNIYSKIQQHGIIGLGSCLTKTTIINK